MKQEENAHEARRALFQVDVHEGRIRMSTALAAFNPSCELTDCCDWWPHLDGEMRSETVRLEMCTNVNMFKLFLLRLLSSDPMQKRISGRRGWLNFLCNGAGKSFHQRADVLSFACAKQVQMRRKMRIQKQPGLICGSSQRSDVTSRPS